MLVLLPLQVGKTCVSPFPLQELQQDLLKALPQWPILESKFKMVEHMLKVRDCRLRSAGATHRCNTCKAMQGSRLKLNAASNLKLGH